MSPVFSLRKLLCMSMAAMAAAVAPTLTGLSPVVASIDDSVRLHAQDSDSVIIMMCRRAAADPMQHMQAEPKDLPLLCVAAQTDENVVRMTHEQMRELIDRAARTGGLSVITLHPQ